MWLLLPYPRDQSIAALEEEPLSNSSLPTKNIFTRTLPIIRVITVLETPYHKTYSLCQDVDTRHCTVSFLRISTPFSNTVMARYGCRKWNLVAAASDREDIRYVLHLQTTINVYLQYLSILYAKTLILLSSLSLHTLSCSTYHNRPACEWTYRNWFW